MLIDVKEIFTRQAEWQKSRKSASWGDKIRQSAAARDALGKFDYKPSAIDRRSLSVREKH
jgi:hypothetical protein